MMYENWNSEPDCFDPGWVAKNEEPALSFGRQAKTTENKRATQSTVKEESTENAEKEFEDFFPRV